MKIAIVTDNGKTISRHFGRASQYVVFTIEDGHITRTEQRHKSQWHGHHHQPEENERECQHSTASHTDMFNTIQDCDGIIVPNVICAAYAKMEARHIPVFVSEFEDIKQSINAYINAKLDTYADWLH